MWNNIFLVQGRMLGRSIIDPTRSGRVDGRLRSSNSRNETSGQFRVIGKSGRCFRAIPWLVTAYHRVARQPTAPDTRVGLFLQKLPGGVRPLSSFLHAIFPPLSSTPLCSYPFDLPSTPGRLNSSSRERSIMDPDHSFPVHSIRIIWHPADVRKARNREAAGERSER